MPRGGRRAGAGRKAGGKNRPRLLLSQQEVAPANGKVTASVKMKLLRRDIATLVHGGMSTAEISASTKIPLDELEGCFAHELKNGSAIIRAEALLGLKVKADGGAITALRAVEAKRARPGVGASLPLPPTDNKGCEWGLDDDFTWDEWDWLLRRCVEFWSPFADVETLAKRMGTTPDVIETRFASELQKKDAANFLIEALAHACGGNSEAARCLWTLVTNFDLPAAMTQLTVD